MSSDTVVRPAGPDDARALADLEQAANVVGLAHVFPAAEFPFPHEAVLARWVDVLDDPDVVVEVVDLTEPDEGDPNVGLACYAARDATTLLHLAVHPDRWGQGLGTAAVERAAAAIRAGGRRPHLWCLRTNERAYDLYARLGWTPTGRERPGAWPPHPVEVELVLP